MVPFITVAQLFVRVDHRLVGMQLLDSGVRATRAEMENPLTEAGERLLELMSDASEELMAAAAVGARYTELELRQYGGGLVISIVCGLTLGPILERRVRATADFAKMAAMYERAAARVQELRKGERIFWAVPLVPEAGQPEIADSSPRCGIDPPSITQGAQEYFGCTTTDDACCGGRGGPCGCGGCVPLPPPYPGY